jgi:enoyl-CoA hydratase/carnithine racemase
MVPTVLNPRTLDTFAAALAAIPQERTRFLVLRGHSGTFCKGLDLRWITSRTRVEASCLTQFADLLDAVRTAPMITLALVDGETFGGGLGILSACDFVFATPGSTFALPEGRLGLIPGIILPFLQDKLSAAAIKQLVFTGRAHPAPALAAWGLVQEVVEPHLLEARAAEFLQGMRSCRASSIVLLKELMAQANPHPPELLQVGVENLLDRLARPSVRARLAAIAEAPEA